MKIRTRSALLSTVALASVAASDGTAVSQADNNGNWVSMKPTQKMELASVTKSITAVATMKLLRRNNLTVESLVWPYLPVSSVQLVKYLAHLRHGSIINPADLDTMDGLRAGWSEDANGGDGGEKGVLDGLPDNALSPGVYWHAGDLFGSNNRELHTCAMTFDDGTEATLLINSALGAADPGGGWETGAALAWRRGRQHPVCGARGSDHHDGSRGRRVRALRAHDHAGAGEDRRPNLRGRLPGDRPGDHQPLVHGLLHRDTGADRGERRPVHR